MMGGNLIAWIKEEFFLLIVTNNRDVSGLLIDQMEDPASIETTLDWHRIEQQRNNMGTGKKQLIREMQAILGKWEKAFRLPHVYLVEAEAAEGETGWFCRLAF